MKSGNPQGRKVRLKQTFLSFVRNMRAQTQIKLEAFFLLWARRGKKEGDEVKWTNLARGRNSTPKQKKRGEKWETYWDETDGEETGEDTIRTSRRGGQVGLPDLDRSTEQRRCQSQHAGEENLLPNFRVFTLEEAFYQILIFKNYYKQLKNVKDLVVSMHRVHLQHIRILHFPTNLKHLIEHKGHWVQLKGENLGLQDTFYTFAHERWKTEFREDINSVEHLRIRCCVIRHQQNIANLFF